MLKKLCSVCGGAAEISLCQIVSTVGRAPRLQRCTTATPFCAACLQRCVTLLHVAGLPGIEKPLGEAFTALAEACGVGVRRPSVRPIPTPSVEVR